GGTYRTVKSSSSGRTSITRPNVGEPGRASTSTSWTAPRAQRTSLASPRPPRPCRPLMVPRTDLDWLSWMNVSGFSPAPAATAASNVRVNSPRRSRCGDGRNSSTPSRSPGSTLMLSPSGDISERRGDEADGQRGDPGPRRGGRDRGEPRSEEHTSELQSRENL